MNKLPSKLGDLIRLAIKDLERCEADSTYQIEMEGWYTYDEESGIYKVCLAGAVLAKTLEMDPDESLFPTLSLDVRLNALDLIRMYMQTPTTEWWRYLVSSFETIFSDLGEEPKISKVDYHLDSPDEFKAALLTIANHFDKFDVHYIGEL